MGLLTMRSASDPKRVTPPLRVLVQRYRDRTGRSVRELAERARIATTTLQRYIRGDPRWCRHPVWRTVVPLARELGEAPDTVRDAIETTIAEARQRLADDGQQKRRAHDTP